MYAIIFVQFVLGNS